MKKLKIVPQCPSIGSVSEFYHDDCDRCVPFWKGRCTAQDDMEEEYAKFLTATEFPACGLAHTCRWHLDAVARGTVCAVRRVGMLCEHQGGEWNTFDVAPPEEWEEAGI